MCAVHLHREVNGRAANDVSGYKDIALTRSEADVETLAGAAAMIHLQAVRMWDRCLSRHIATPCPGFLNLQERLDQQVQGAGAGERRAQQACRIAF